MFFAEVKKRFFAFVKNTNYAPVSCYDRHNMSFDRLRHQNRVNLGPISPSLRHRCTWFHCDDQEESLHCTVMTMWNVLWNGLTNLVQHNGWNHVQQWRKMEEKIPHWLCSDDAQSTVATKNIKDAHHLLKDIKSAIESVGKHNVFIVALNGTVQYSTVQHCTVAHNRHLK